MLRPGWLAVGGAGLRTLDVFIEVGRTAELGELTDTVWMAIKRQLGRAQRLDRRLVFAPELVVEDCRQGGGGLVVDAPETGNDVVGAGQVERSAIRN